MPVSSVDRTDDDKYPPDRSCQLCKKFVQDSSSQAIVARERGTRSRLTHSSVTQLRRQEASVRCLLVSRFARSRPFLLWNAFAAGAKMGCNESKDPRKEFSGQWEVGMFKACCRDPGCEWICDEKRAELTEREVPIIISLVVLAAQAVACRSSVRRACRTSSGNGLSIMTCRGELPLHVEVCQTSPKLGKLLESSGSLTFLMSNQLVLVSDR